MQSMTFPQINKSLGLLLIVISLVLVNGIPLANSRTRTSTPIQEARFVTLGGIEQWISIRSENRANPVLLVVHGGPGEAQWPQAEIFKPWEKAFTVVQWDQRGTGHTFGRYGTNTPDVSLDRISRDGAELAQYLCRELGKKKIIVLGHSWGSIVAIHMVQMRPELFAAYVGTGQASSWSAVVNTQFNLLLAKARREHDEVTVKKLEGIGRPDSLTPSQFFSLNGRSIWASEDQAWIQHLRSEWPKIEARDPKDAKDLDDGMNFSGEKVQPDQFATDLPKTACNIDTAFFVIQGQDDVIAPTQGAVDYFKCVKAPKKQLILIPHAGHFAWMTASDRFLRALISKVRPIAVARGA